MALTVSTGNDLAAHSRLHRDLKQRAGDVLLQLLADAAAFRVGVVCKDDHRQGIDDLAVEQKVQTDELALVPASHS